MSSSLVDALPFDRRYATIGRQLRSAKIVWALWYFVIVASAVATGLFIIFVKPIPAPAAIFIFLGTVIAIAVQPRFGLYFILFVSLVGDSTLMPWYPFVKNMSSQESLLYLNSAIIVSPMECYLVLTLAMWLGRGIMQRKLDFYRGELFWPGMAFCACMVFGLFYGLLRGGNLNIALWEVRPILYLPILLVLASNLLEKPSHVIQLMWVIMIALFIEGVIGAYDYLVVLHRNLDGIEAITEHSAAIHMNTLFVFAIAVYLFGASKAHRLWIPLMVPVVFLEYLATQRRAAYVSLGIAILFIFVLLYQQNRRLFWAIAPALLVVMTLYMAAFWNSTSAVGLPAAAVKSIVAPDAGSKDYSSNEYRIIEDINDANTVHSAPLTGVGFGNKFHIIVPMPDISFFIWWEYIVHNSILWIWMETGVVGFMSMLFLIGSSIMVGVRAIWRLQNGAFRAILLVATMYVVMHFMYAYVDMSWDTQSMLYVGTMMGVINCAEHIAKKEDPLPARQLARHSNAVAVRRATRISLSEVDR